MRYLLILLFSASAFAQSGNVTISGNVTLAGNLGTMPTAGGGGGGGGPTYFWTEDFENGTTGFDSLSDIISTNAIYAQYTPALVGTQSAYLTNATSGRVKYSMTGSTYTEIDGFMIIKLIGGLPTANELVLTLEDGSGNVQLYLYIRSSTAGTLQVFNGSSSGTTSGTIDASNPWCIWYHWKTDGTANVAFAQYTGSQTRPTSGANYASCTGGTGTTAVSRAEFKTSGGARDMILDHMKMTTGALIGDNP